jgi:alpha-D-ribose 1-methylphosphonate 5-phosphate C-P lyase
MKKYFGKFRGLPLKLARGKKGLWVTLNSISFQDAEGDIWEAPSGSITNGASIPRFFWRVIGPPMTGEYVEAAVIHDVYCVNKDVHYVEVHKMFYNACRASGVKWWKANLMYWAVRLFGPKW